MIQQNKFWRFCIFCKYARINHLMLVVTCIWSYESHWDKAPDENFSFLLEFSNLLKIKFLLGVCDCLSKFERRERDDPVKTFSLHMLMSLLIKREKCFSRLVFSGQRFRTFPFRSKRIWFLRIFFICGKSCGNEAKAWGRKPKEISLQVQYHKWLSEAQANCLELI